MKHNPKENRDAAIWLLCAGLAAVTLVVSIFLVDTRVMFKLRSFDITHNEKLRELRMAQYSLPAHSVDEREELSAGKGVMPSK